MIGFQTLLRKEILRFWKVAFQTVAAPVLTSLLYLLIFAHVMAGSNAAFPGVTYEQFLMRIHRHPSFNPKLPAIFYLFCCRRFHTGIFILPM
jgi:hypothetical protein